jgi:hypothetical protein
VRNAASPRQIRNADRVEADQERLFAAALQETLRSEAGRLVLWGLLSKAGVYQSVWSPGQEIHYLAGRQDFGHELLALIVGADEELYELMEREARLRARRLANATDAAHAQAATDENEGADV